MSYTKEFQDGALDTLSISTSGLDVWIDITEGEDTLSVVFEPEQTIEVADALYEAAGKRPDSSLVKASDVPLNEALLRVAAAHNVEASFKYVKGDGAAIEYRTLVPAKVENKDDHVTFTGYDPDRDAVRAFRSDRIKGQVSL